jgi:hypothetical protein
MLTHAPPVSDVISLGFATTVFPVARAGAIYGISPYFAYNNLPGEKVERQVPWRDEASHADRRLGYQQAPRIDPTRVV